MANIAVLLEPFPMRNSFGAQAWIGDRLCRMLLAAGENGYAPGDMRIICNEAVMTHLAGLVPEARPTMVQPDAGAQSRFADLIADWHTKGLAEWAAIQAGSPAHEPLYEALLWSVQASYPFDVLAYWGTNETVRRVADRLGIPVLWAEYGPLRPPFPTQYCLDHRGVNGHASSRDAAQIEPAQRPALPGVALDLQIGAVSAYEATLTLPAPHPAFDRLMRFVRGQDRVVLLVMQLADDANILAFGRGWTCRAMVEAVMEAQSGPGTVFILRPHPAEGSSYHTFSAGEAVRALVQHCPDVLVHDAEGPDAYLACLSVATEVVCINSSVGFEAAILGKPVRVLGEASLHAHRRGLHRSDRPAGAADRRLHACAARRALRAGGPVLDAGPVAADGRPRRHGGAHLPPRATTSRRGGPGARPCS